MGFDNECILNIQSLAGEYFCPVCRLLVYPSEALQSQCTHLYCKPCLSYVVSTTKACPYDGYLVTEADSKPLIESNKPLAETIGKIEVHCLYHRSGCPWKGPLSDCTNHCSGCAFGNSPVVCNRCGVQIVHRQVQDHAQNCPGVQSQALPTGGLQSKSATVASADQAKVATQPGSATSQALPLQGTATPAQGQNQNQPAGSINYPQSTAQITSDQWYQQQQQYQQYYQPYAGYDPYQQYNPYQQQSVQQYQQHQGYAYPPAASAVQILQSTQAQPQTQIQPHPQAQPQPQPQPLSQPPTQSSVQPPPQTQPHSLVNVQPAVTQQLQPHLSIPSLPQMQPHTHQTDQSHPQPQPQQHHHSLLLPQSHSMQPYPQQQQQLQPHLSIPSLPQMQPHTHQTDQSHSQPQPQQHHHSLPLPQMQHLQPQAQPQPQPQMPIPQPRSQAQPPVQARFPTQQYQPAITKIQTPVQHPSALPMTSRQSYPQIQAHQQVQLAVPQHIAHMNLPTGPSQHVQHVSQVHAQLPQQTVNMRPSQPQCVVPNSQPPALLPSTGQSQNMPSTQNRFVQPPQQQGYSGQHHPYMQSNQQVPRPPQFVSQQSSVPQQQLHMPMNAQLHPQGLPLSQNQSTAYLQSQQTGMPPYQSQVGPSMSNINVLPQSVSSARHGVADNFQVKPTEVVGDQKYASRTNLQLQSLPELQSANSQFEDKHLSGKSISGHGVKGPEQQVYNEEANTSVATSDPHVDSVETNVLMSETDPKLREDKPGKDKASLNGSFSAEYATGVGPELRVLGNGESTINNVMKHGAGDGTRETMSGNPQQDSNGLQDEAKHPSFQEDARQKPENHDKGSLASHYGPSSIQQKSLSGQIHVQVPGHPHHQYRSQNADTFLPPAPGGMFGPRPERGIGQPPTHRSVEQSSSHPGLNNQGFPGVGGSFLGAVPPGSIDSHSVMTGRAQPSGPDGKTGLQRPNSRSGLWGDGFNKITREGHLYPFDMEPGGRVARVGEYQNLKRYPLPPNVDSELVHGLGNYFPSSRTVDRFPHKFGMDPLSRNSDKGPHGFINDTQLRNAGERPLPGGFGEDNMGRPNFPHPDFLGPDTGYGHYPSLASCNSHQEYPGAFTHGISPTDRSGRDIGGRNSRRFGERSRPSSLHSESKEFLLHEKKFPNMPPHLRRGEPESNMNMQMGDNVPPGPSHMLRSGELIGHDLLPSHFHRGEHFGPNSHLRVGEPAAFGAFSSHRIGDMSRFGNFPTRRGEAGFKSIYSPQDSKFFMGEESFENPRKRKSAASMGRCRICKVDCETVEGLDVHSRTREHQRKSMDMVLKIKQKNAKKQKLNSTDRSSVDELKESRIGGFEGRGDKL